MKPQCPVCGQVQSHASDRCSTCGGWLDPSMNDPLLGREVGHFRLDALIGRGGMGAIYRATHKVLGTAYAIKLLHPQLASDPTVLERFRREAIAASQLKHNNIVFIADYGWSAGIGAYIVMEFLEGRSLGQALREGQLFTPTELLGLFRQICRGLQAAHKQGIVHRDLKPDNIFLCAQEDEEQDQVKILDFGIARIAEEGGYRSVTQSEIAIGTPHYMSPEQAQAQWDLVDARTDIYALGVILYKVLTGKTPFPRTSTHEVLALKGTGKMTPLETYRPDLEGSQLAQVVAQLLSFDRDDRPPDAKAVLKSLQAALEPLPDTPMTMSSENPGSSSSGTPQPKATKHLSGTGPSGEPAQQSAGHVGLKEGTDPPSFPSGPSFVPVSKPSIPAPQQEYSSNSGISTPGVPNAHEPLPSVTVGGITLPIMWVAGGVAALLFICGVVVFWPSSTKPTTPKQTLLDGGLPPLVTPGNRLPAIPTKRHNIIPLPPRVQTPDTARVVPRPVPRPVPRRVEVLPPKATPSFTLRLRTRPRATAYMRGRDACRTPCTIKGKLGATILIYVRKRGYKTRTYRWSPTSNKKIRLRLRKRRKRRRKSGMFENVPPI